MIPIDLSGKVAIVTGASQGIGAEIVRTLSVAGASVVVNFFDTDDGRNRKNANEIISSLPNRAIAVPADVRDRTAVEVLFQSTQDEFNDIDIVINNAGIIRDKTIVRMTADEWSSVLDTNLTGTFNVGQAAARSMKDGGRIVNISSVAAALGSFGQANYVAAKSGVIGLTKVLARELAKREITVNAVAPGAVDTTMVQAIPEEILTKMLEQVPLGRLAKTSEIASVVLFLCSDLASYVSGQTIHVNGGWCG